VALGVDPDGDQRAHIHHLSALTDLEDQGVGRDVYRPASSGRVRNASTAVSSSLASTDT
jgi:hypothetical protein